jgi:hypothetical protein
MQLISKIYQASVVAVFMFCSFRTLPAASSKPQLGMPVLKTDGSQFITVQDKDLDAEWLLRLPEVIGTNDTYYMVWEHISVPWKDYGNGEIGYEWKPSPEWLQKAQQYIKIVCLPIRPGIGVAVRMRPSPGRIDLSMALMNLTDKPLEGVWSEGGCFAARSQCFFDNDASHSYIETARGLMPLSQTDRSLRVRCRYAFEPSWYDTQIFKILEWFWGRSTTRPKSSFIGALATDGRGAVGIGYDHSRAVWQNSDNENHCMHSEPYFGTLQPGQTVERRGVIIFGRTIPELFKRFEALGYRPDRTPPSK